MKTLRTALLLTLIVGLTSLATASSLGTFTSETDVTVSGDEALFSITLMNTGDEPLFITLEPRNVDNADVQFSNNSFTLKASNPTENPSDEGSWYYLGDGEYVRTQTVDMRVTLLDSSSESLDVDISAQPTGSEDQETPSRQDIVQVRSYSYSVTSDGSEPETEDQTNSDEVGFDFGGLNTDGGFGIPGVNLGSSGGSGSDSSSGQENDGETDVNINESEDGDAESREALSNSSVSSQEDGITGDSTNSPTGNFFQSQNINGTTIILILGVMVSATYLYKVM